MTTSRLFVLLAALLGMSMVFFLPKYYEQPVGITLQLPEQVGEWVGTDVKITQREIDTLGKETQFARKSYKNSRGDELRATIVLAGHDMNTSIHRPERCLPAQGWSLMGSSNVAVAVPERGVIDVKRLKAYQMIKPENSDAIPLYNLNYYWFVGSTETTASHTNRWRIDKIDRLFHGYNQRWAYFTVDATITEGLARNGLSEEQTARMIEDFIKRIVPETHRESVKFSE